MNFLMNSSRRFPLLTIFFLTIRSELSTMRVVLKQ